jgi:hypothetical protein
MYDLSDLADSIGIASGWRTLARPLREDQCSCHCAREDQHQRPSYLVERNPEAVFGTDEKTAPPVIGQQVDTDKP